MAYTYSEWTDGVEATTWPAVPGVPTFQGNDTTSIDISFSANSNPSSVTYVIEVEDNGTAGQYLQNDGTIGASEVWQDYATWGTTIRVTGLVSMHSYRFRVKSLYESTESEWSTYSSAMQTRIDLSLGPESEPYSLTITTGNTLADSIVALGTWGNISLTYRLTNKTSSVSRVVVEFYDTDTSAWVAATSAGGDGLVSLTASPGGTSHTFIWNTATDLGMSYSGDVDFRITPYDTATTGGSAADPATATITVNNLPAQITLVEVNGYTWDKDSTPTFTAIMGGIRAGNGLYFLITAYDSTGNDVVTCSSAEEFTGWEYEQSTGDWHGVEATGVDPTYANGTNKVKYTFQTPLPAGAYTFRIRQAEALNIV